MPRKISSSSQVGRLVLNKGFRPWDGTINESEALHWAAEQRHTDILRLIISESADVNGQDLDGNTPLHFAARGGCCNIISMLTGAGASVTVRNNQGESALHEAAQHGHCEAVKLLVELGIEVSCPCNDGYTPLHLAAALADTATSGVIGLLHSLGADISSRGKNGMTPLHFASACEMGTLEAINVLLDLGANLNEKDDKGFTSIHWATMSDQAESVQYLAKIGADTLATNKEGFTALHSAADHGSRSAAEVLLKQDDSGLERKNSQGQVPLHLASLRGHTQVVCILLDNGASLEATDNLGCRPLHLAAARDNFDNDAEIEARNSSGMTALLSATAHDNLEVVRLLADWSADVSATNPRGRNSLHIAVDKGNKLMARLLLERGVDIEAKDEHGWAPLSLAAANGNVEMTSLLLEEGADIEARKEGGWTPLHIATSRDHADVVEMLLAKGADLSAKTNRGLSVQDIADWETHPALARLWRVKDPGKLIEHDITVFIIAAENGNTRQIESLLEQGVVVDSKDIYGRGALPQAARNGRLSAVDLLVTRGANVDLQNANGETALWWASRCGHVDIVRRLLSVENLLVDLADCDGQTPLIVASHKGHKDIVDCLLRRGSDPNKADNYGQTALIFTAGNGHLEVAQTLIKGGADVNYATPKDETAAFWARERGYPQMVDLLRDHGTQQEKLHTHLCQASYYGRVAYLLRLISVGAAVNGVPGRETPLMNAAEGGYNDAITALVDNGAAVDRVREDNGHTALSSAAIHGHSSTIKLLFTLGSKLDSQDNIGRTALSFAASHGHEASIKVLLDLGALKEIRDQKLRTPLWHASSNGHTTAVKTLLDAGADIESCDENGYNALTEAVNKRFRDVTKLLLHRGAQMRPESLRGDSPLSISASNGAEAIVNVLIEYGAKVDQSSADGSTALTYAATEGHIEIVRSLIEAGADVGRRDDHGKTALTYAKERGHELVVNLLSRIVGLYQTTQYSLWKDLQVGLYKRKRYHYHPLDDRHIRILELHPGTKGDFIRLELSDACVDKEIAFEALSYEWKETVGTLPVQCGQDRLLVTPNCKAALENLRHEDAMRLLWIDAICIDQENKQERKQQVAMMTDIFRSAETVLMWLGAEISTTEKAFEKISLLFEANSTPPENIHNSFHHTGQHRASHHSPEASAFSQAFTPNGDAYEGMMDLVRRPYFTRVWIFQEIILGTSNGVVICGRHRLPWQAFKSAVRGFQVAFKSSVSDSLGLIMNCEDWFTRFGALPFGRAASAGSYIEASDARDKIFAILGLASMDVSAVKPPVPDYTLPVNEVFITAVRYCFEVDQGARIWYVNFRHGGKKVLGLPSWVPDFDNASLRVMTNPFSRGSRSLNNIIKGRPITTDVSLHTDACLLDDVVFRMSITREADIYGLIRLLVETLDRLGIRLYDSLTVRTSSTVTQGDTNYVPKQGSVRHLPIFRRKKRNGSTHVSKLNSSTGATSNAVRHKRAKSLVPAEEEEQKRQYINSPTTTYAKAILDIVLWSFGTSEQDLEIASFLAWKLSVDETFRSPERPPEYLSTRIAQWNARSQASDDFDLDILLEIEKRRRAFKSDLTDLILTKSGHLGLTGEGAQEGMMVALVGGAYDLSLLRKKQSGQETWFEFVDTVFMYHLRGEMESLEDIDQHAKIERLEIR